MKKNTYFVTTVVLFVIVLILHSVRILFNWDLYVGTFPVPMWLSWAAVIVLGILAFHGLRLRKIKIDNITS